MKSIYIIIFYFLLLSCKDNQEKIVPLSPGEWILVDFSLLPGITSEKGINFTIEDSLYIGLGIINTPPFHNSYTNKLWRYTETATSVGWKQMKDFPGQPRTGAVAFTIDDKAYIGLGRSIDYENKFYTDFWIYNTTNNSWDSLLFEFPGDPVADAVAFSLNGKGYIGTGLKANGQYSDEFYQFDPQQGWGGLTNMLLPRAGATTFQLNGNIYLCFGHNDHEDCRDVYKFDPDEFRFHLMNSLLPDIYPGITRSHASSFVLKTDNQEYAYIIGGELGLDVATPYWYCCRYNYVKDIWEQVPSMPRNSLSVITYTKKNIGYAIFDDIAYKFIPEE